MVLPLRELDNKIKADIFGKPIETIMQCCDFKSNFARRLSNRHIDTGVSKICDLSNSDSETSKSSLQAQRPENLKNYVADDCINEERHIDDGITNSTAMNVDDAKLPELPSLTAARQHIHHLEVNVLNTQVDTLRWTLKQTEANRLMHIALLEQVVSFLHKVKEHMVAQNSQKLVHNTHVSTDMPKETEFRVPRTRSAFHVNNVKEYTASPVKKISSMKKQSKSISNVSSFRNDFGPAKEFAAKEMEWRQSKRSLVEEEDATKIMEELSRLINLADTVLTTKIPTLSCCGIAEESKDTKEAARQKTTSTQCDSFTENAKEINTTGEQKNGYILNTSTECRDEFESITNKYIEARHSLKKYTISPSPLTCGLEDDFALVNVDAKNDSFTTALLGESKKCTAKVEKKNDTTQSIIEDESGFSSMSSFQEIGIPVINVSPPTPSRDNFLSEDSNLIQNDNWKSELIDLDKQSMKVFWV